MTLGLSQITNDAEATIKFLEKYGKYFDEWFITVADKDKKQYNRLRALWTTHQKLELSYFKTPAKPEDLDFSAIRNFNLEQITTDYWFWADSDDEIIRPKHLKDLLDYASKGSIDVIQLNYDYAQDESGNAISDHIRERLIRRTYEGFWDAPCHETFQGPPCIVEKSDWVEIKHVKKSPAESAKSIERNKAILQKHYEKTGDPRDAQYLGMTAMAAGDLKTAIAYFLTHVDKSGAPHDIYRSWCRIAECEWQLKNFEQALYATDEAIKVKPEFPDAYHIKVMIYTNMEEYEKGLEWLKVAATKAPPETLNVVDPTLYAYRGMAMGAMCFLFAGKPKEAFQLYSEVIDIAPNFFKNLNKHDDVDWDAIFQSAYFDTKAIDYVKWLLQYTKGEGGKPEKLFESLPARIFSDVRLNAERANFLPKVKWPEKSIVFFCGQATETWGPDTLDKGMGGSEEAVVYLSRELAKIGWKVTVYNEREEEYVDRLYGIETKSYEKDFSDERKFPYKRGDQTINRDYKKQSLQSVRVTYKPWTLFNPWDEFDVFVAWRMPSYCKDIKARLKVVDMHDVPQGYGSLTKDTLKDIDKVMFKSNYHASLAKVPDEKKVIIGNGIVAEQFK